MNNSILPSNPQGPQVPKPAWKLWKYLESLYRIGGWISPSIRFLAQKFKRGESTIRRWMGILFRAGVLASERRGPRPPVYRVLIATTERCISRRPYMSVPLTEPSGGQTPLAKDVAQYFGNTELGGKPADQALIARVARLIRDQNGLQRLKDYFRHWMKRNRAEGWGIFIRLAEDAGRR
jgi:hypothetical protein